MRRLAPLIRLLADDYTKRYHVDYDTALDRIYRSEMFKKIQDEKTTFSTWAPQDLLDYLELTNHTKV